MDILYLDEWFPYPLDTGKKIRTYNLLRALAQHNRVTYLCYQEESGTVDKGELGDSVVVVPVVDRRTPKRTPSYYLSVIGSLSANTPFAVRYARSIEMSTAFERALQEARHDVLICEWTPYAQYFRNVSHPCKVLMAHNVEFRQWERMYRVGGNMLAKALYARQWKTMRRFEEEHFALFDGIVAVTDGDRGLIDRMGGRRNTVVVENGVDLAHFEPMTVSRKNCAVFTASMDAFVNVDAALYYANAVFPLVRRLDLTMEFHVVGRSPLEKVQKLAAREGIVVTGTVPDVRPYVARSAVSVVPVRAGGGSRLKILEAMAMGIPVVSTSIGAEGLQVCHGENIILADDARGFAEWVVRCARDQDLRERLIANGQKLVRARYGWDSLSRKFVSWLENLVQQRAQTSRTWKPC